MGYRTFTKAEYEELRRQHNIMVLVGNGFDIQVTRRYGSRFSPRYPAFYHYLLSRDFDSSVDDARTLVGSDARKVNGVRAA